MEDIRYIKLRRATAAEWAEINPVLREGEPAWETDAKKLKVGDGVTPYSSLPYSATDLSAVATAIANAETATTNATNAAGSATSAASSANTAAAGANASKSACDATNASVTAAESARVSAESGRVSAESARVSAESSRVSAESSRVSAESTRASNEETRIENETARQSAEATRSSLFNSAQGQRAADFNTSQDQRAAAFATEQSNRATAFATEQTNRGNTFTGSEASRATTFSTNEGASTDAANANGSRWARFNASEASRAATFTSKESQRDAAVATATALTPRVEALEDEKVSFGDYDPSLRAGVADTAYDVIADNTETETFTSRVVGNTSGGHAITNGNASVKVMKGNSVVANQLEAHPNFDSIGSWTAMSSSSVSVQNGELICSIQASGGYNGFRNYLGCIQGHKYLISIDAKFDTIPTSPIYQPYAFKVASWPPSGVISDTNWHRYSIIGNCSETASDAGFGIRVNNSSNREELTIHAKNAIIVDITKWYNGNVPEGLTAEQFLSLNPQVLTIGYNEGTLISNNATAIRTIGKNLWDEEWEAGGYNDNGGTFESSNMIRSKNTIKVDPNKQYYINLAQYRIVCYDSNMGFISSAGQSGQHLQLPSNCRYIKFNTNVAYGNVYKHDIIISHNENSSYEPYKKVERPTLIKSIKDAQGNVVFHNGLLKAGSVADSIDYRAGKAVKRIGVKVFDGSEVWGTSNDRLTYRFIGYRMSGSCPSCSNILVNTGTSSGLSEMPNKSYLLHINSGNMYVREDDYNESSWQSHLEALYTAGTPLVVHYELDTPIEYTFDPSHLDYPIVNGGVEELVADGNVAPIVADITYPCSQNGTIASLLTRISALESKLVSATNVTEE